MRIETIDHTSRHLPRIKALGAANSGTLGFLPEGAFDERARKKQIIAAIDSAEECVGYLLYRMSRERAIIVHLCVSDGQRRNGLASELVEYLKAQVKDLKGIGLRCRRDYNASRLWPRLNFVACEELAGRGRIPTTLTFWWFDNGHPTLFTDSILELAKSKICAMLDANVFFDLIDPQRLQHEESKSLLADWLSDSLELCVSGEILNEIDRNSDDEVRRRERESFTRFTTLPCDNYVLETVTQNLKEILPEPSSLQRDSDRRQLARTIASNARVFVTRDQDLLDLSERLVEEYGLSVLRPADLVIHLDEVLRTTEYLPQRLAGTLTQLQLVQSGQEADLTEKFRAQSLEESPHLFHQSVRRILSNPQNTKCYKVLDVGTEPMGLCAYSISEDAVLEIPLLRVRQSRLAITLARQLAFRGVMPLKDKVVSLTRITDPYIDEAIAASITNDGFVATSEGLFKINVNLQSSAAKLVKSLSEIPNLSLTEAAYRDELITSLEDSASIESPEILSRIEHLLWPFKFQKGVIPTFIVSIKPEWAKSCLTKSSPPGRCSAQKRSLD